MTAKKVIIYTALIIGGIFVIKKLTKKEEPEEPSSSEETASGINGAQYLYLYEKGAFGNATGEFSQTTGRCYCGPSKIHTPATSANDCAQKCGGNYRWIPALTQSRTVR